MSAENTPELSLVIPCYNEAKTLAACVAKCLELTKHGVTLELIIVDDCSTDKSVSIAENLVASHPEVRLLRQPQNMGKGAALRRGFVAANGQFVGIQDADAEYEPLDYLELLKPLQAGKADVVYGSRYLRPGTRRVLYFWHTWMNRSLTFVSNMITNLDLSDMETCYKLFSRKAISTLAPKLKENRFGFEPEITCLVAQMNYRIYECAIHYEPRSYEEGKKIGWKDGMRALYCILHYGAPYAPLPMQLILYFFIGAVCAVTNVLLFSIFITGGLSLMPAVVCAFILAAIINYLLCILILFRHKSRFATTGELAAYITGVLIMCAADYGITASFVLLGVSDIWSKCWATLLGFIGNFILRKYFVF